MDKAKHPDAELIKKHGGPKKFAELLGMRGPFDPHRVSNWNKRGIPSEVKCEHPAIFFAELINGARSMNAPPADQAIEVVMHPEACVASNDSADVQPGRA